MANGIVSAGIKREKTYAQSMLGEAGFMIKMVTQITNSAGVFDPDEMWNGGEHT